MLVSQLVANIDAKADHSEKMTPEMIKRIVGGKESLYALSKELGCSYSYLRLIKQGKIYRTQVAEALKELNLPSAEIHEQDTKLPSSHVAPTANIPQHSVDISAYENPSHLLELFKSSAKFANLSAWEAYLSRTEGSRVGGGRRFALPESYTPKEVKINSKKLENNKLELQLIIAYTTDKHFDEAYKYQNTHFVMKGSFEVAVVKGRPSLVQKGKLELSGSGASTHASVFKSDAEKADITKLDNEVSKHNEELIKHFTSSHKGEVEKMVAQVAKNSNYDIKETEVKWKFNNTEFEIKLHLPNGKEVSVYENANIFADVRYENGKVESGDNIYYANRNSSSWEAKEVRPKIESLTLNKTKTLESVKNCFERTCKQALSRGLTEKADEHSKQALTEAFHHFMSQAHFTAFKIDAKEEHNIYKFEVVKNGDFNLSELLSKGDYNSFTNTVKGFDLKLKDGKPVFEDARGRVVDSNTIFKELDNYDRLASKNIAKRGKALETMKHETADLKAKIEAIVLPVGGRVVEYGAYGSDADTCIYAEITKPKEKQSYGDVYFAKGTAYIKGNLGGTLTYSYKNDLYRDSAKKSSKDDIIKIWQDNAKRYKEWLAKN